MTTSSPSVPPSIARLSAAGEGPARTIHVSAWRPILGWWLASRGIVFGCALIVQVAPWPGWHPSVVARPFALLGAWDSGWYSMIASRGYFLVPGRYSDPAFFPLLGILERLGHGLGLPNLLTGIAFANAGFAIGLVAFYELGREFLPEADVLRAAIYLAIFPLGFVFSMAYPEGVVLPLMALAGLFALRDRWPAAAVCATLATLARPEAAFLVLPLAALAVGRWPLLTPARRVGAVAAACAGPAALASLSTYLWWQLGDPLAWSTAERAWGRSFSPLGLYRAGAGLLSAPRHHNSWVYRDLVFCVVYLVCLLAAHRARVPLGWVLAGAATVLLPLASGSFNSDGRFGLLAFAAFWGLAVLGRRPWLNRAILTLSPLLLGAFVLTLRLRWP